MTCRSFYLEIRPEEASPAAMQLGRSGEVPSEQPLGGWLGFYWGTSFGLGSTSSKTRYRNQSVSSQLTASQEIGNTGSLFTNEDDLEQEAVTQGHSNSDSSEGALIDLYRGLIFN
jgi:hypothetical protein